MLYIKKKKIINNGFHSKILQNKNLKNNNFLQNIILLAFTLTVRQNDHSS